MYQCLCVYYSLCIDDEERYFLLSSQSLAHPFVDGLVVEGTLGDNTRDEIFANDERVSVEIIHPVAHESIASERLGRGDWIFPMLEGMLCVFGSICHYDSIDFQYSVDGVLLVSVAYKINIHD